MAEAAKKTNPAQQTQEQQIAADIPPSKPGAAPAISLFESGKPYIPHKGVAITLRSAMASDFDTYRGICMTGSMINVNKDIEAKNLKRAANDRTVIAPAGEKCVAILNQAATATLVDSHLKCNG